MKNRKNPTRTTLLHAVILVALPVLSHAQNRTNQLLRSGPISQFADTKIYTSAGVEVSVGEVDNAFFHHSEEFATALASADQATGIVEPGWGSTASFEEWTDRLILTRTTTYTLVDGARFYTQFLTGEPFQPSPNIVTDDTPAPDILQLVSEFIDADGHLDLYPAAAAAGEAGPQELLDELGKDVGPVTFTEVLQFSRFVPELDSAADATQVFSAVTNAPPEAGAPLDPQLTAHPPIGFSNPSRAGGIAPEPPIDNGGGVATYQQNMLNGFTSGHHIYWTKAIGKATVHFETTLTFAHGVGVRIPWHATVTVEPSYITKVNPDQTPFASTLGIGTLDAPSSFYSSIGVHPDDVHGGKELVLLGNASIAVKLKVFGKTLVDRPVTNPLVGGHVDLGAHFDPPINAAVNVGTPSLPFETTGIGFQNWLIGIGADFKANLGLTGQGFELNVAPHNAWSTTGGGLTKADRTLLITAENDPGSLPFAVDDDAPKTVTPGGIQYYRHGAVYSDAAYHTNLNITPNARIRGVLKLSNISRFLNDINLSTSWYPIYNARFDLPQLGPHSGTESIIEAYRLNRRELDLPPIGQVSHELAFDGFDEWTVTVLPGGNVFQITELLGPGVSPKPGSIAGGGRFDPASGTITWTFQDGRPPAGISYQIVAGQTSPPRPIGSWIPLGETHPLPILNPGSAELDCLELALQVHHLSQRPTLEEVQDARLGSTVFEIGQDGKIRFTLDLESTADLDLWTPLTEIVPFPIEVEADLSPGKRFFRFSLE